MANGYKYVYFLLYVIVFFVVALLVIIAFLCLLMCRTYYAETHETQARRCSFRHSLKRIKEFKKTSMSGNNTSTENVAGNPV